MPLPSHIRVKLSSEAAGAISLSQVVVREMPLGELIEEMLALMGKDAPRLRATLARGSFITGGSRFRWEPFEAADSDLAALLASYPDADASIPFEPARCVLAVLQFARRTLEVPREAAVRTRFLRKRSFWDALMRVAAASQPSYAGYSYRRRADAYRAAFAAAQTAELAGAAKLLRYPGLRSYFQSDAPRGAELFVPREGLSGSTVR